MFSETTDSDGDALIPCGNTSDCRSMPTLSGDAYCQNGYCMCPRVDIGVQACSSINASMHKNKVSGDAIGNIKQFERIRICLPNFLNKTTMSIIPFLGPLVYRTCKHDQDCNFLGGICNSTIHQCVCLKNYVPSSNRQRCIKSKHREIRQFFTNFRLI